MVGKPVVGSKATPTGATAGGLPTNTLAPLPTWPEAGTRPMTPLERPNTPPWLNTVSRRRVGSSIETVADRPFPRVAVYANRLVEETLEPAVLDAISRSPA